MLRLDFQEWLCPMLFTLPFACQCCPLIEINHPCYPSISFLSVNILVSCCMLLLRNGFVALSNLILLNSSFVENQDIEIYPFLSQKK